MSTIVRVWDLPTRIFHWTLVVCIFGLVISAQFGGEAMAWHFRLGYVMLSLLLFRIVWGLIGGHWSRFVSFLYSPAATIVYLKGPKQAEESIGHNPLGAASVFALLGFLLVQVASGLISDDEISAAGPLTKFVSGAVKSSGTFYHKDVGKLILIGLVALHIGAILMYLVKKGQNLVRPMIRGDKVSIKAAKNSRDDWRSRTLALVLFLSCAALVAWMVRLAG